VRSLGVTGTPLRCGGVPLAARPLTTRPALPNPQAGRPEERQCRFCHQAYALDWRDALGPGEDLAPLMRGAAPVMAVNVRGRVHKLRVQPGPDGKARFHRQVQGRAGVRGGAGRARE
jgi:hypothetical protein